MRLIGGTYNQQNLYRALSESLRGARSLHVVCILFFERDKNKLIKIFEGKGLRVSNSSLGEIVELKFDYTFYNQKKEVYFYIYQHPIKKEIFFLFSFCNLTDLYRAVPHIIKSNSGTYCLWLSPQNFDQLKEEILSKKENYMTFFHGNKIKNISKSKDEIKIEYDRDIRYKAIDAQRAAEKLKVEYGISPSTIEFVVPSLARFKITKEGIYTLKKGDVKWFFDKILERIIEIVKEENNKIEASKIEIVKEENKLDLIQSNIVNFKSKNQIDFERFPEFLELMKQNDFMVSSSILKKGSVIFAGEVIDRDKGNIFSLSTNGKNFIVAPLFCSSNTSIIRFYRFLTEKIDQNITITNEY